MKSKAIFYHAGCPVCVSAEQAVASAIDNSKYDLEIVHFGTARNRIDEAEKLGVSGWVRNRADSSVEAVVHGPAETVAQLVDWASHGPRFAAVSAIEESQAEKPTGQGFEILSSL